MQARERLFDALRLALGEHRVFTGGRCVGSSARPVVQLPGGWAGNALLTAASQCKTMIAMENAVAPG